MEDSAIIDLYWLRSECAIEETAQKYGGYCYVIAKNILALHEDSEECVNETYLRAWESMPPQRPSVLSAFLGRIVRNLSLDRWQKNRAQKRGGGQPEQSLDELADCLPDSGGVEQVLEAQETERILNDFVAGLEPRRRRMFVQRYWYLYPISDIANAQGMSLNSTKTALFRLRQELKKKLEQEGIIV